MRLSSRPIRPNHVTLLGNNKMPNDALLKVMLGDYTMNTRTKYSKQLLREATEAVA